MFLCKLVQAFSCYDVHGSFLPTQFFEELYSCLSKYFSLFFLILDFLVEIVEFFVLLGASLFNRTRLVGSSAECKSQLTWQRVAPCVYGK